MAGVGRSPSLGRIGCSRLKQPDFLAQPQHFFRVSTPLLPGFMYHSCHFAALAATLSEDVMTEQTITPLEPPQVIELTPPQPVAAVPPEQAVAMVKLASDVATKLDNQVTDFIQKIIGLDVRSPEFREKVDAIHSMGTKEIQSSSSVSNRLLDKPMKAMQSGVFSETSKISRDLIELRRTVEDLDPGRQGDLFTPRKILGFLPFGDKLLDYFDRYTSAQSHLNTIIESLYSGQDELKRDNASIEQEKANLWDLMQKLEQFVYLGKKIDSELAAKVATIEATDVEKARIVKEEIQFYVRQKVTDLMTQMAVNVQGYLALDLIRKNNLELIKGVDRATTTTISALRTAVIVAQALANQKLVLDQITALNTTTSNIIESTSNLLRKQSAAIHEQAAGATVNIEQLQRAFNNIYATMDAISTYKIDALDSMGKTVEALTTEVTKAKTYVDRVRQEETAKIVQDVNISDDGVVKL